MRISGIYGLRNVLKSDEWYVGQSWDICKRWRTAYSNLQCKSQVKLYNALKKYGYDNFEKVILEETTCPQSELDARESYWMFQKDSIKRGYNIRGAGSHGRLSDETKKKISNSKFGKFKGVDSPHFGKKRPHLVTTRVKMVGRPSSYQNIKLAQLANVGRIYTKQHSLCISAGKLRSDKKFTTEERFRISEGVGRSIKNGIHKKNKIPKSETETIKELYLLGKMNKKQLSVKYGVTPSSMGRFLNKLVNKPQKI